ncbi:FAD:protein FMN transferase [Massilia glaciei]|uniref:FAD:protein FMN transferase n=2 Tax=Massilia glaciei TaxID=1524097 RepID=A0A2U2HGJ5_9BURK|nr:FAD:protein FMN transferase [Massilia glaciei]
MGTRYSAVFYTPEGADLAAIGASLFAAVDRVDRQMSTWNPASDLCRLNAAAEGAWTAVPDELAEVLEAGVRIGVQSKGAFDIGLGDLVQAWGFGPSRCAPPARDPAQDQAQDQAPRQRPACDRIEIDRPRRRVRKRAPIAIDLSGIAKGYGVDQLAHCLDGWGIGSYLVGIDGEMRARGSKPGGGAWAVAIEKPVYGVRAVSGVMQLEDTAIATSGDYRRWVEVAGRRYAHTMSPALQQPVSNRLAAVTVLAATCMLADAWATALLVLGEREGPALARERGMDALFVLRDGERLEEVLVMGAKLCEAG